MKVREVEGALLLPTSQEPIPPPAELAAVQMAFGQGEGKGWGFVLRWGATVLVLHGRFVIWRK
jgi:hypothetical protein